MKRQKLLGNRTLALVLAVLLIVGLLPMSVFAVGEPDQIVAPALSGKTLGEGVVYKPENNDFVTMQQNIANVVTGGVRQENVFDVTTIVTTKEELEALSISPDAAVVLVMDMSSSMVTGGDQITPLKSSAVDFLNGYTSGLVGGAKRLVSVVEFGWNALTLSDWVDATTESGKTTAKAAINAAQNKFEYYSCNESGEHTHDESFMSNVNATSFTYTRVGNTAVNKRSSNLKNSLVDTDNSSDEKWTCSKCGVVSTNNNAPDHYHCTVEDCTYYSTSSANHYHCSVDNANLGTTSTHYHCQYCSYNSNSSQNHYHCSAPGCTENKTSSGGSHYHCATADCGYVGTSASHTHCTFSGCAKPFARDGHKHSASYPGPHGTKSNDEGHTFMSGGLLIARNLISSLKTNDDYKDITNLYVVLFTDGVANRRENVTNQDNPSTTFVASEGNDSNNATQIKYQAGKINDLGAKVLTIQYKTDQDILKVKPTGIADKMYKASNTADLLLAFANFNDYIKKFAEAWTVKIPLMNNMISVTGITNSYAAYNSDEHVIMWNLMDDELYASSGQTGNKTYTYTMTYRVTLDTLANGYAAGTPYPVSGVFIPGNATNPASGTFLNYVLSENGKTPDDPSKYKTAGFTVPTVKGFDAPMNFLKIGGDNVNILLDGCDFKLTAENKPSYFKTATSGTGDNGQVDFTAIPSGQEYTLEETSIPADLSGTYELNGKTYTVKVSYGQLTIWDGTTNVTNNFKFNNPSVYGGAVINISKTVLGDLGDLGASVNTFEFGLYDETGINRITAATSAKQSDGSYKITLPAEGVTTALGSEPSKTFIVKEIPVSGETNGSWTPNTQEFTVTIARNGTVTYTADTNPLPFTNTFNKYFKVTVNYYVDGALRDTKVPYPGLPDEDPYAVTGTYIYEPYYLTQGGDPYYLVLANSDAYPTETNITTVAKAIEKIGSGNIAGKDVVINLYYMKLNTPTVNLTKSVELDEDDMTMPASYEFSFVLTDSTGAPYTQPLTVTKSNIDTQLSFTWLGTVNWPSMRGQTLYIKETTGSNWSSAAASGPVAYGKFNDLLAFQPDTAFASQSVTNTYSQPKATSATINLRKYFEGEVSLAPFYDGAEPVRCGLEAHTHIETCSAIHTHDDDLCYETVDVPNPDDDPDDPDDDTIPQTNLICDQEGQSTLTCPETEHTHELDCYAYTFVFDLVGANGTVVDTATATIPYGKLLWMLEHQDEWWDVEFTLTQDQLPDPGVAPFSFSIVERPVTYVNWHIASEPQTVSVDPYGDVTYPDSLDYAVMTNNFDGITPPKFSFTKTVIDARSLLGGKAYYDGTFTFGLYNVTNPSSPEQVGNDIIVDVENGIKITEVDLSQFIGKTVDLEIREYTGSVPGMTYDTKSYSIKIVNGEVTEVNPGRIFKKLPIVFVNTYLEPIEPVVTVSKTTNGMSETDAIFSFTWEYEGYKNPDLLNPEKVEKATGSGTLAVAAGALLNTPNASNEITLPLNFTGKLTITEINGGQENWQYDANDTRTLNYVLGKLVGKNATSNVSFTNNYYKPHIDLDKIATPESTPVIVNETAINYTIIVTNDGAEPLKNVVITDDKIMLSNGVISLAKDAITAELTLTEGIDYSYEPATGTITLAGELGIMEKVYISYKIIPSEPGPLTNTATVTATRTLTVGANVTDTDTETVIAIMKGRAALKVDKQVAEYVSGDPADITTYSDATLYLSSAGRRAAFRVAISNIGEDKLFVTDIADIFGTVDLANATFYYNGTTYAGLATLVAVVSDIPLENVPGSEIVFYFISDALAVGNYTNTVTVSARDSTAALDPVSDTANVSVTVTPPPTETEEFTPFTPNTPPAPEPPEENNPDPEIPQTLPEDRTTPPEDEEEEEDVTDELPLADMPYTGGFAVSFLGFAGLGLFGLGAFFAKGKKED